MCAHNYNQLISSYPSASPPRGSDNRMGAYATLWNVFLIIGFTVSTCEVHLHALDSPVWLILSLLAWTYTISLDTENTPPKPFITGSQGAYNILHRLTG